MLGAVAGSRFANTSVRTVADYLGAALGSFAVAISVAAIFAFIVITFLPFRPADVVIAFAPGSQDQMMLLALALNLDPVYVGAHHLSRWLVVTFSIAVFAQFVTRGQINAGRAEALEAAGAGHVRRLSCRPSLRRERALLERQIAAAPRRRPAPRPARRSARPRDRASA